MDPQSNDCYRGPTELVQHFAKRGSSHRHQAAGRQMNDITVRIFCTPFTVGRRNVYCVRSYDFALPSRRLEKEGGLVSTLLMDRIQQTRVV
jgi:hypothetical protein